MAYGQADKKKFQGHATTNGDPFFADMAKVLPRFILIHTQEDLKDP